MDNERVANPRVLLPVAALAGVAFSAIAIFVATGYQPDSDSDESPAEPVVTETMTVPSQPPPPPVMLPPPMPQVPCMGWTQDGCPPPAPQP